ncbi:hypothetical protein SDC9_121225 [bioreactor metagenome]|uniref:Uncharacterized protein n=1 Tax=bioreactor metagenome TaxID=1076179 RepID=A0A645CBE0_9ZZZZ
MSHTQIRKFHHTGGNARVVHQQTRSDKKGNGHQVHIHARGKHFGQNDIQRHFCRNHTEIENSAADKCHAHRNPKCQKGKHQNQRKPHTDTAHVVVSPFPFL